jgi:hypothetical protein
VMRDGWRPPELARGWPKLRRKPAVRNLAPAVQVVVWLVDDIERRHESSVSSRALAAGVAACLV